MEGISSCRYESNIDKRSGLCEVDLTAALQELLASISRKGRSFRWLVMQFGVANALAVFRELINKIMYKLRRKPLVQEPIE